MGRWVEDSVQTLLANNHRLQDIENYTIDQFVTFLDAAERADAVSRVKFTIDVLAAMSSFNGSESLEKHLTSLGDIATGE